MENLADYKEIIEVIKDSGGDLFKRCFQCGLCDTVWPWNRVRDFSLRKIVRQATFGMTEIESEDIWRCTTCGRWLLHGALSCLVYAVTQHILTYEDLR